MPNSFQRLSTAVAERYRIERELGAGGMATVYLAEDLTQSAAPSNTEMELPGRAQRSCSRSPASRGAAGSSFPSR